MSLFADYRELLPKAAWETIAGLRQDFAQALLAPQLEPYRSALASAPDVRHVTTTFDQPVVRFQSQAPLSSTESAALNTALRGFCPWKKGPFDFFGTVIDSEWRSDLKWQRLVPHLPPLENQVIADIGCHNGYFMYRMLAHHPRAIVGFEPVPKHWYAFQLLQKYARAEQAYFEGLGVEHIDLFLESFDIVFCLGILYHHTDPVGLLRKMRLAMRTGATLVIDCQGIPGDEPVALTPRGRYAGASGIWFLPTPSCLQNWVHRAGFRDFELVFDEPLSTKEQRATAWAQIKSLADFLSPDESSTIEGYPAPRRFYALARR